jgi:hypothetical protein
LRQKHVTYPWDLVLCEKGTLHEVSAFRSDKRTTNRKTKKRDETKEDGGSRGEQKDIRIW